MPEIIKDLLTQGGLGIMAAIFFWLYNSERKDHQKTRDKYEGSLDARREEAKENMELATQPLNSMAKSLDLLNEKIILGKGIKQ